MLLLRTAMSRFRTLLSVIPYPLFPTTSAGRKSILHFNNRLSKKIKVVAACAGDAPPPDKTSFKCVLPLGNSKLRYINLFLAGRLARTIKESGADFVLFEHPYMAWMGLAAARRAGVKWGIRSHNIEYDRFRSFGKWWWKILRRYELWLYSRANAVFFITDDDQREASLHTKLRHSFVMPTGMLVSAAPTDNAACKAWLRAQHDIAADERILLYNGALDYGPNVQALDAILETINPQLMAAEGFRYKLLVCGNGLPEKYHALETYRDQHIIFCGFVDDISIYFKGADVYLNPLIGGGGIKTRTVEALAFNTNVVSSQNGSIGLNYSGNEAKVAVVADFDWAAFAAETIRMAMAHTPDTTQGFYDYYCWDAILDRFIAQVDQVLL